MLVVEEQVKELERQALIEPGTASPPRDPTPTVGVLLSTMRIRFSAWNGMAMVPFLPPLSPTSAAAAAAAQANCGIGREKGRDGARGEGRAEDLVEGREGEQEEGREEGRGERRVGGRGEGRERSRGEGRGDRRGEGSEEERGKGRWEGGRRDEGRRDEGRRDEGRRDEGRRDKGRRDVGRRGEGRRDEWRRSEGRRDEWRRDEYPRAPNRDPSGPHGERAMNASYANRDGAQGPKPSRCERLFLWILVIVPC